MAGSIEYLVPSSSYVNIGMERCKNHDHSLSPAIGSTDWNSSDHLGHYYITVDGVRPCRILDVSPAPSSSCGNSYYYYYYYYVTRTGTAALVPREWPDLEVQDDDATRRRAYYYSLITSSIECPRITEMKICVLLPQKSEYDNMRFP